VDEIEDPYRWPGYVSKLPKLYKATKKGNYIIRRKGTNSGPSLGSSSTKFLSCVRITGDATIESSGDAIIGTSMSDRIPHSVSGQDSKKKRGREEGQCEV
jgi:hypothetical protein